MFGSDGSPIIQYVSIFAVIFAVLTVIVLVVRRLAGGGLALTSRNGQRGRQPRLGIVDVYELDRQRQLILLRRDNVEHLLLVGGPNDVVVERNIQRGRAYEPALRAEPLGEPQPALDASPDEPELPPRRPALEPDFAMPVVVPPAVPRSTAVPPVTHPLDAAALGPDPDAGETARPAAFEAPQAPASEPVPAPAVEPPPPPRPEGPAKRLLRRTAPKPVEPAASPEPEVPAAPASAAPPMPGAPRRTVDPAILSDMARQLQAALGRPASAVTPPPAVAPVPPPPAPDAPAAPPARRPVPAPPPPAVDPMAAAMAAPPEPAAEASPKPAAKPASGPAPTAEPASPPAAAKAGSAANPFSVEEIEAEFARLLGRPLDKR